MCDQGWSRPAEKPRHPCPRCGEPAWDVEPELSRFVGTRMEYRIVEVVTDPHLVLSLGLSGVATRENSARVRLPHRLKETYRHAVKDHGWKDGIGLVITFDKAGDKWGIFLRPPTSVELRRERTDACRRHQWARGIHLPPFDVNGFADQIHCSCPTDPACEVCVVAAQFAVDRRLPGSHGDRYWDELRNAVMRDLGLIV
jgi:hypothetical protein